jgi:diacylglycerol kinase (ATP)
MDTIILINPHAAGGRARQLIHPLQVWCQELPTTLKQPQVVAPDSVKAARQILAALPSKSRVIIVGGDGTLNQMLPTLLKGQHVVGLVPYGSGNDCARAWGLHRFSWQKALTHALQASPQSIDLGRVELNDNSVHYFHSSLAVGFDASVGNRALAGPKYLRGLPRYLLATLRELVHLKNWPLKIETDGQLVHQNECLLASTLNTPTYGAGMPAVPHASVQDGQLNLLIGSTFNRLQTLLMLPRLLIGQHLGHPRIQCVAFSNAYMQSSKPVPVAIDGETLGDTTHLNIQCLPNALQVLKL